jgi:hypothetical protein
MVETVLPNLEREQRQQIVLIEDDLLLRFRATAKTSILLIPKFSKRTLD